jgi:4-hydroxy-tetrahydrodipicolinate reductase
MLRIALIGARGRLGSRIAAAAADCEIIPLNRGEQLNADCDVVIDVSHPDGTAAALQLHKPLVIGTTGHSAEQLRAIESAAREFPIVLAPNFSVGVNALFWLTRKAAELLGDEFDIEVVETHHRLKKDAPSGTAKRLVELLSRGGDVVHGREGMTGERPRGQIGVHAIRAGDVVGDHTVIFAGAGERLELTHKASSRDTFAAGAVRAARWIVDKPPRLYSMEDVLGL